VSAFSPARRAQVTDWAGHRREYCHLSTRGQVATFPIDHVLPRNAGGDNDPDNLALTCPHCNAHKWMTADGPDPETGDVVRFYHPRLEAWDDQFQWDPAGTGELIGKTANGRATILGLRINDPDMIRLRLLLAELGLFAEAVGRPDR
jgi:hypothetical protein